MAYSGDVKTDHNTEASLSADTRITDPDFQYWPTTGANVGQYKQGDGIHTYAQLPFQDPMVAWGGGGGIAAVNATAPLTASGTTTRTIAATTSEGGNGATDNGKLLVFGPDGSISGSSATGSGVVGTGNAGPGVKGTSVDGTAIRADNLDLSSAGHIFEGANKDGLKITVLNDGSIAIADDAAKAATRAALGLPNVYAARVNAGGTLAATIKNTIGGTPAWTQPGTGNYQLVITGAFTADKTICEPVLYGAGNSDPIKISWEWVDVNTILVWTRDATFSTIDGDFTVKIEVYS